MMRYVVILISAFLVSCGAPRIKNDRAPISDVQANYESLLTSVGKEKRIGNGVYVFQKDSNLNGINLEISTVFEGTYQVRSDGCFVDIPGRYLDSEVIKIPVLNFLRTTDQPKTCTITIQVSPTVKNSEYTIFPRYSIIVLTVSEREKNLVGSRQLRIDSNFDPLTIELESDGRFQIVRKCTYEPQAVLIGPLDHNGFIELDSTLLSQGLQELDANGTPTSINNFTEHLGNCYFSIQYSDSSGITKYGFTNNVFKKEYDPLTLSVSQTDKEVKVEGPKELYVCKIDGKFKLGKSSCSQKLKDLPKSYVIEGHTNKRSTYILIGK